MEYSEKHLKQLHTTLLEILDYIDDICKQNNIVYMLIGGSALGAKRHSGFIPWDDDMDIGMARNDYNKFIKIMHSQNSQKFKIQDGKTESNYFLPFVKVRKQNTIFDEEISHGLYKDNGIFVDIFPIDTLVEFHSVSHKVEFLKIKLLNHALRFKSCKKFYKKRKPKHKIMLDYLLYLPFAFFSNKQLLSMLEGEMIKQNKYPNLYAANFAGTNKLEKEIMPYEVFFPPQKIRFEGRSIPCPNNIDLYLTNLYGDYQKLPDPSKRHMHEPLRLVF